MRRLVLGALFVAWGMAPAKATLAPGTAIGSVPDSAPPFLLLAPQGDGSFSTPLPFSVVAGDVVILASSTGGVGTGNWSEVISFTDVNGHGLATVYELPSFTGFVLDGAKTGEVDYLVENSGNSVTRYMPGTMSPSPQGNGGADGSSGLTYYLDCQPDPPAVPEPSTWIAGVSLLLPFGVSISRIIRKTRWASK